MKKPPTKIHNNPPHTAHIEQTANPDPLTEKININLRRLWKKFQGGGPSEMPPRHIWTLQMQIENHFIMTPRV